MSSANDSWIRVENVAEIPSPSLLVYPDRVEENVRRMIRMAGGVERLRPHMKTHKMPEVIRLHLRLGITKFKCATIAEAEMTAGAGALDVLLAYQPVGPNAERVLQLVRQYPQTQFTAIADDEGAIRRLSEVFSKADAMLSLSLDLDCGQHRCGVEPGERAAALYRLIHSLPGLRVAGLHAYEGHLHDADVALRTRRCEEAFTPVNELRKQLLAAGLPVPTVVAGGTPTFPMHAERGDVECSPGTCVFWDFGYSTNLPDLDFLVAALLLTRVVSKPGGMRLCLDLGHKSVASESPHPRMQLPGVPDAQFITHSEEHLVIETAQAGQFAVGDALYAIPRHICPTVALHAEAVVIRAGCAAERWKVAARDRRLTI